MPGQDPAGKLRRALDAADRARTVAAMTVAEAQRRANEAQAKLLAQQVAATVEPPEEP